MNGLKTLTREQAQAEVASWSALHPIHVGAGWHSPVYGGNAVVRLLKAAGASVDLLTDENGNATLAVNGMELSPWGEFAGYYEVMMEIERVLGLPQSLLYGVLEVSDEYTYFDPDPRVMDFVTDYQRGAEEMKRFVAEFVLPLLPRMVKVA